ncbi:hypothetical protein MLD38_015376 [Melastoma candidum]|uniref:Uncharacterized protein n=1 Tax=Melastoma candidum TaxID=119954 RepID=A0ACB9RHT7_9MYRT|nr:hypothetical protein MLD38_015376 [Melastoma candidum]
MYGDATGWDEEAYRDGILKERRFRSRTVFRTAWVPSPNPGCSAVVVSSSDGSVASYSIPTCISSPPLGYRSTNEQDLVPAEPDFLVSAHDGPAYDVKFYGSGEDALLLSCGDDGHIRGWIWKELGKLEVPVCRGDYLKPAIDLVNPQARGPWGALSPIPETNALAVDEKQGSIYAACGDSSAYCWDVETGKIKMVFKGHSDYLHCIAARNSSKQIISGSEDGSIRVWDCRSGRCIQVIDPDTNKNNVYSAYISCVALDASDNWLVFGSGRGLSIWNLPASECISKISTAAPLQDVLFDDNEILAVGAQPVINRYAMDGALLSQNQCAPQSVFSISLHQSGVIAVGGYGGLVDVISQFGSHLCTFYCKDL